MKLFDHLSGTTTRLRFLFRRGRLARDIADELAFHLAMKQSDACGEGVTERAAAARRAFGNVGARGEEVRDVWTFPTFESLVQDARYAVRSLAKAPGFTLAAVVVLALGIAANTAIYSLVHSVFVRGLPFPDSDRLVLLIGNVQRAAGIQRRGGSYPDFVDWRKLATSFDDIAVFEGATVTLREGYEPEQLDVEHVSPQYFTLLGVEATAGRVLVAADEGGGAAPVVVLSDGLWKRRFGGEASVVGRTIRLGVDSATVVGVTPAGFAGLSDNAALWLPYFSTAGAGLEHDRGRRGIQVVGRLKRGVSQARAQAEVDAIAKLLAQAYPESNEKRGVEISALATEVFGDLRPALGVLMAAVSFVLLLACANVANLVIGRAESRRREIAVRAALGAGRGRLARQLLTESLVLVGCGAAAGLAVALVALRGLVAVSPVTLPSFVAPELSFPALAYCAAAATACGIVLGLAPAAQAGTMSMSHALKSASREGTGARSRRTRSALVIAEVSFAVVLLVGAGLMVRSMSKLLAVDPGFDASSVLTFDVNIPRMESPPTGGTPDPPLAVSSQTLLDRVRSLPGVVSASLTTDVPLGGSSSATFFAAEGDNSIDAVSRPRAYRHRISPEFFATLGVPLVAGRPFAPDDGLADRNVAIVSEALVKRYWPGQEPLGKRLRIGSPAEPWISIVGVVPDLKYRGLPRNPTADPDIYFPFTDQPNPSLIVRTSVPPVVLTSSLRHALKEVDPAIVVYNVQTLTDLVAAQTQAGRFTAWLLGVFAATALALAAVGIYALMSYLVTLREREFGIRLALGAGRAQLLGLVMREGMALVGVGLAVGLAASILFYRLMRSMLFELSPVDPSAGVVLILLGLVALGACLVPALRASRINPSAALQID